MFVVVPVEEVLAVSAGVLDRNVSMTLKHLLS
jgi:hypothetical protein